VDIIAKTGNLTSNIPKCYFMKIFYRRLLIGNVTTTTPFNTGTSLPVTEEEEKRANELSPSNLRLFDCYEPQPGKRAEFEAQVLELGKHCVHVIPELCDDEGRQLAARIAPTKA
jgi:hypothetical protein